MKTKLLTAALMTIISVPAMAYVDVENNFSIGTNVGSVQVKDSASKSDRAFAYGLTIADEIRLDQHKFQLSLSALHSEKIKMEQSETRLKDYDAQLTYKYGFALGDTAEISPKVGFGYNQKETKLNGQKHTLERTYAVIGAEAKFQLNDEWSISPEISYEKDLNTKFKNNVESFKHKGDALNLALNAQYNMVQGNLSFGPYFKQYDNDGKINQYGVAVKYEFND